jgi:SAM-dependent methyltransferase
MLQSVVSPTRSPAFKESLMELAEYRESAAEQARTKDLMALLPAGLESALDIGARDGFISRLLAERVPAVTALDLERPQIDDPRIACVKGDATALDWADGAFDLVVCAEVLEHLPGTLLGSACAELSRVSKRYLLIGVPYKQDLRLDRSTCVGCGRSNPPWGHVNSFDEARLASLFPGYRMAATSYVGQTNEATNFVSSLLMQMARNPYGTYVQDEPCIHCGAALTRPPERNLLEKGFTRAAVIARKAQRPFIKPRPKWIHVLFEKRGSCVG